MEIARIRIEFHSLSPTHSVTHSHLIQKPNSHILRRMYLVLCCLSHQEPPSRINYSGDIVGGWREFTRPPDERRDGGQDAGIQSGFRINY